MLIRSLATIVFIASSFILVTGQTPDADKTAKTAPGIPIEKQRDLPFPGGVSLQWLIKELATEMDLNVLFDPESRLEARKVRVELKNVSTAEALNLVLLQEGLYSEAVGPKTIMVASRASGTSIPRLGVGFMLLGDQLARYFGVEGGILINHVRPESPGAKAGLKAGDVIVGIDGDPVRGPVGVIRAIEGKKESEITLRIVRDRKDKTMSVSLSNASP